jgi:hypothetical protein
VPRRPRVQQLFDDGILAVLDGFHEGGPAQPVDRVDVAAGGQQFINHRHVPRRGGEHAPRPLVVVGAVGGRALLQHEADDGGVAAGRGRQEFLGAAFVGARERRGRQRFDAQCVAQRPFLGHSQPGLGGAAPGRPFGRRLAVLQADGGGGQARGPRFPRKLAVDDFLRALAQIFQHAARSNGKIFGNDFILVPRHAQQAGHGERAHGPGVGDVCEKRDFAHGVAFGEQAAAAVHGRVEEGHVVGAEGARGSRGQHHEAARHADAQVGNVVAVFHNRHARHQQIHVGRRQHGIHKPLARARKQVAPAQRRQVEVAQRAAPQRRRHRAEHAFVRDVFVGKRQAQVFLHGRGELWGQAVDAGPGAQGRGAVAVGRSAGGWMSGWVMGWKKERKKNQSPRTLSIPFLSSSLTACPAG